MEENYFPYTNRDDAVEEYRSLRAEITESQKQRITLLQYSLAFMAAFFGYSFKNATLDSVAALFLIVISVPATLFSYSTRCRERRIAHYIGTVLGRMSPWSRLSESSARLGFWQRTSTAIILTIVLLDILMLAASFPIDWPDLDCSDLPWVFAVAITLLNCGVLWKMTHLPDYRPRFKAELERLTARQTGAEGELNKSGPASGSQAIGPE